MFQLGPVPPCSPETDLPLAPTWVGVVLLVFSIAIVLLIALAAPKQQKRSKSNGSKGDIESQPGA